VVQKLRLNAEFHLVRDISKVRSDVGVRVVWLRGGFGERREEEKGRNSSL